MALKNSLLFLFNLLLLSVLLLLPATILQSTAFGTISGIIKFRLFSGDGVVEERVRLYQRGTGQGVVEEEEAT